MTANVSYQTRMGEMASPGQWQLRTGEEWGLYQKYNTTTDLSKERGSLQIEPWVELTSKGLSMPKGRNTEQCPVLLLTSPKQDSPCSNGKSSPFYTWETMQRKMRWPTQGPMQSLQKWKPNSRSVTESNTSAPGCSSHRQKKSSNRYNFKTTAHLSFTTLMAFAEPLPEMADNDVCY